MRSGPETSSANLDTGPGNPSMRHEHRDVDIRLIVWSIVGLAVTGLVIHVFVWWLFRHYEARANHRAAAASPLAVLDSDRPLDERLQEIREPRLEGLQPTAGLEAWPQSRRGVELSSRAALEASRQLGLDEYGWVSKEDRVVRIPIERAFRVILEQNLLPARSDKTDTRGQLEETTMQAIAPEDHPREQQ